MARPKLRLGANPIVIKELRSRMRGPRAFIILTAFLLLLGTFTYGLYRITTFDRGFSGGGPPLGAVIGRSVFIGLAFFELMLVCLITPALTAGAISSEEERRTLDMLLATPMHAASVLWGKLISALTYVFLLILAAIPMASIVFILGGVTAADMLQALGILVLCAVTFGTLGLFFSVILRRTGRATVASYVVMLLLMFGLYFLYVFVSVVQRTEASRAFLYANPIAAMAAAVAGDIRPDIFGSMMGSLTPMLWALSGSSSIIMGRVGLESQGMVLRPLWHYTAGIYGVLTLALYFVSVQLLKPIRRWRLGRAGIAGTCGLVLALAALGFFLYGPPSYARFGYPSVATATPDPRALLSSVAPAIPMPAVERVVVQVTAVPGPTPTGVPPADLPPDQIGSIYAAAIQRLIEDAPTKPRQVLLYDTTSAGLLADPQIDGSEPQPLGPKVLEVITERVGKETGIPLLAVSMDQLDFERGLGESILLVAVGRSRWIADNAAQILVSRYWDAGPQDARLYTLQLGERGWVVVEDSGPLNSGEKSETKDEH